MKKQFQILAATFITAAFISCSKEKIEDAKIPASVNEEISTSSSSSADRFVVGPLTEDLEGSFQFNGNLKDNTQQLGDGVPTVRGVIYTTDRKGKSKSAVYLNGYYGIKLKKVPQQTNSSISVWIKPSSVNYPSSIILYPETYGQAITQVSNLITCGMAIQPAIPLGAGYKNIVNTDWRHIALTYDGQNIRVYIDNVKTTFASAGSIPPVLANFFLGYFTGKTDWTGAMDDLRFYSRTLSDSDVQALFNQ